MLSKKMAFSLTSLITILALAFIVPPAMAQVKVEVMTVTLQQSVMDGTVTHSGGHSG